MTDSQLFNNISLGVGGRGVPSPGQLKIHSKGILWKKQGGGKEVEVDKADILAATWMKIPRTNQLGILIKDGLLYKLTGFRDQDLPNLTNFFQSNCGITMKEKQLSVKGRNWGEVDLNENLLTFMSDGKQVFEVSLTDVSQTQLQGKNDVLLQFHVDDTTGANEKDALMEMSFHVPSNNTQFIGDENRPPAQVFRESIMKKADGIDKGREVVVTFEGVAILTPRGRYSVELYVSFLRLQGQANDFQIQYSSVVRLFLLPKSNQPHTFVIVTLDPPYVRGKLCIHTLSCSTSLSMSEETLNKKYKNRLESTYKGLIHEVFTTVLRGLSGAKVTKPGKFRSCQDGYAVKSSLKAEDGLLYPLEKSFFFLPKPPTLILHEEIDYVEFERHAAGGSNMHYFDLLIRLKTEQEHLFRNIQRNEYHNLFDFISEKGLKIMNLGGMQPAKGVAAVLQNDDDDAVDPHLERIRNENPDESDEEDEDFVAEKDDGGSPTDDSGGDDSDGSDSGNEKEKPVKKEPVKESSSSKVAAKKKPKDGNAEASKKPKDGNADASKKPKDGNADASKKRKQKKKKDPNAPKKAMSAFMYYSQMERENVKRTHPGIAFGAIGKVLGEGWKKLSAEEKEPYEAKARSDKKRYEKEISGYKNPPTYECRPWE